MDLENLKHQVRFGARSLQRKLNDILGARIRALAVRERPRRVRRSRMLRIPFKPAPPDELYCFDYGGAG